MAPRKRKETPKPESEDDGPALHIVPDEARRLIEDLEEQVKERSQRLLDMKSALQQSIRQEFSLQLLKLPKQVRDMPLKQFKEQYKGDINSVLLEDMEKRLAASVAAAAPATSLRTRARGQMTAMPTQRRTRAGGAIAETPALGIQGGGMVGTVMRAPRGNEILYSKNGSPLGYLEQSGTQAPVLKTTIKGQVTATPFIANQGSTTVLQPARPGGKQVQVTFDGGLDEVPAEQREEVTAHLTALQKFATSVTGGRRRR